MIEELFTRTFATIPYSVYAAQITDENMEEIAEVTEATIGINSKNGGRFIVPNPHKSKGLGFVYAGGWVTKMENQKGGFSYRFFTDKPFNNRYVEYVLDANGESIYLFPTPTPES